MQYRAIPITIAIFSLFACSDTEIATTKKAPQTEKSEPSAEEVYEYRDKKIDLYRVNKAEALNRHLDCQTAAPSDPFEKAECSAAAAVHTEIVTVELAGINAERIKNGQQPISVYELYPEAKDSPKAEQSRDFPKMK